MQLIVNGLLVSYTTIGEGKLVLLLHGWGDSSNGLAALQQELGKNYQVVAVDLPGFGGSQAPKAAWDLDDYSEFLQAFLQKLETGELYAIVGHSNGGALAIRALALQKVQGKRLVLLAASGIRSRKSLRRLLLQLLAKTGNLATIWMPERYRDNLRRSLYGAAGSDALVVESMRGTFEKVVRQDVQQDAASLSLPTLLIYAENDDAVPLADGRRYHRLIKGSELKIVPGAGHFLHLEEPQIVAAAIKDFLS